MVHIGNKMQFMTMLILQKFSFTELFIVSEVSVIPIIVHKDSLVPM